MTLRNVIQGVHQTKSVKNKKPEYDLGFWEWRQGSKRETKTNAGGFWAKA